jgi:hypothetical protein
MKLMNTACKNATPKEKPYKMTDGASMFLYVMPTRLRPTAENCPPAIH